MSNRLHNITENQEDITLVRRSLNGDRKALDQLVRKHQPFIYNVAWKMVHDPNDAMDLTQEVLVKVITKLAQFKFKSSFRTWLYRIVVNEFLQTKRRPAEERFTTFSDYGERLDAVPNPALNQEEKIELAELSREMQVTCMSGMIMCLTREQRLIYILGDSFGINHQVGAQLFGISPANFRVKLHRARKELGNYMQNKCGLVNSNNPCRCPKKAKALKEMGVLSEDKMQFNVGYKTKIADYVANNYQEVSERFYEKITELYRDHPARDRFPKETIVEEILKNDDLMGVFEGRDSRKD